MPVRSFPLFLPGTFVDPNIHSIVSGPTESCSRLFSHAHATLTQSTHLEVANCFIAFYLPCPLYLFGFGHGVEPGALHLGRGSTPGLHTPPPSNYPLSIGSDSLYLVMGFIKTATHSVLLSLTISIPIHLSLPLPHSRQASSFGQFCSECMYM